MAPPTKAKPPTPPAPEPIKPPRVIAELEPATENDGLPVVTALGYARTRKGWVPLLLEIEGGRVTSAEVLYEGVCGLAVCLERLKIAMVTELAPRARGAKGRT